MSADKKEKKEKKDKAETVAPEVAAEEAPAPVIDLAEVDAIAAAALANS